MKNNYCEEMDMNNISHHHELAIQSVGLPEWMNVACPWCHKELPLRSIRSFGLCLNTRNLGDVYIEVFCEECACMDKLYFRSEAATVQDFVQLIAGARAPRGDPIIEEEMYKMQYNNLLEKMLGVSEMSLLKRAVCSSNVIVSSSVYACPSCGHTEIVNGDSKRMSCVKCNTTMNLIQTQASSDNELIVPSGDDDTENTENID